MGNIFGFRATDPKVMKAAKDPIGPDNNAWLLKLHDEADLTVGAWGNHGEFLNRGKEVVELISDLKCLKITGKRFPSHPLYLPKSLKPIPYSIQLDLKKFSYTKQVILSKEIPGELKSNRQVVF